MTKHYTDYGKQYVLKKCKELLNKNNVVLLVKNSRDEFGKLIFSYEELKAKLKKYKTIYSYCITIDGAAIIILEK